MKKKLLCLALAGVMVLSMAACGNKNNEGDKNPTPTIGTTQPTEAPAGNTKPTEAPADVDIDLSGMMNSILERIDVPMTMEGSEMELTELYQIDASKLEKFSIRIPMMMTSATEFAVFKAASDADVQAVKDGINKRLESLTATWSTYLPDQFELVEKNKILTNGRYVFFIVADDESSAYAENVFLRKFDPSIKEMVLVRKFRDLNHAVVKAVSDSSITLEYTENNKTYTFECTYSEYFYAESENGINGFPAGTSVFASFEEPVPESEGTMKGIISYLSEPMEEFE